MRRAGRWKRPYLVPATLIILVAASWGAYTIYSKNKQPINDDDAPVILLHNPAIGQHRPEFVLPDMSGTPRNIKEWDKQILIVNFWATWCKPCRREIPVFTQLQKSKGQLGLQFIGIAIDEKPAVSKFISELGTPVNYPMLVGEDDAITIAKKYGNEFGILPYSVIIDRAGQIAFIQYGEFSRSKVEQQINALL